MAFSFEWTELQDALEDMAPTEAQRAKVQRTVQTLQRKASSLPHEQALRDLCAGIWLTCANEGDEVIDLLERLVRSSPMQ